MSRRPHYIRALAMLGDLLGPSTWRRPKPPTKRTPKAYVPVIRFTSSRHSGARSSGKKALRRQIEREYMPPHAARWSGRQWRIFRKGMKRQEVAA